MMAPAPHKSSAAGRSVSSGQPLAAAITAITAGPAAWLPGWLASHAATAVRLRRHPARILSGRARARALAIAEPFGDGKTIRSSVAPP